MKLVVAGWLAWALSSCAFHVHVHEAPGESREHVESREDSVAGAWDVRGQDDDGMAWSARLVLDEQSGKGHFDWRSSTGAKGREMVTWRFDDETDTLTLAGYEMLEPRGNIGVGSYEARLAVDGEQLVQGVWGAPAKPGTWVATR